MLGCIEIWQEFFAIAEKILDEPGEIGCEQHDAWLVAAYLVSPERYAQRIADTASDRVEIAWQIRDFLRYGTAHAVALSLNQMAELTYIFARHSLNIYPSVGSSYRDQNPSDAAGFVRLLIDQIASRSTKEATDLLTQMLTHDNLNSYGEHLRHALANQRTRRRDAEYLQPDWRETSAALFQNVPANVSDLHALLFDQLVDIKQQIASSNTDIYKRFWNEDRCGRITTPKSEESGRDELVELLRHLLRPLGVIIEPEGHRVADKRADISVALPGQKILVELKRDHHPDIWIAAESQLDRFYTRDPEASGFGIYGVFWFGGKRKGVIPAPPHGLTRPKTAEQMQHLLRSLLPQEKRAKIGVIVLDVSEPFSKR